MYLDGKTTPAIAKALGLKSPSTVNFHLKNMGVPRRQVGRAPRDRSDLFGEIRYLFERDWTDPEIALALNLEPDTVRKYRERMRLLRRTTLVPPDRGGRHAARPVSPASVVALYKTGLSIEQLCFESGRTSRTVRNYLQKAGVSLRPAAPVVDAPRCAHVGAPKWPGQTPEFCRVCYYQKYRVGREEDLRAKARQYYRENREQFYVYVAQRRARKRGASGSHTLAQWRAKIAAYDSCCAYCDVRLERPSREHVIPLCRGGSNNIDNLVPACRSCNGRKGRHIWEPRSPKTPYKEPT